MGLSPAPSPKGDGMGGMGTASGAVTFNQFMSSSAAACDNTDPGPNKVGDPAWVKTMLETAFGMGLSVFRLCDGAY